MRMRAVFLLFISGLFLISSVVLAAPVKLDRVVAEVNGEVITQSEVNKKITELRAKMSRGFMPKLAGSELQKKALDDLIDISLQLQLAEKAKIKIDNKELDGVVANIAKSNGLTISQLKEQVLKGEGLTYGQFRKQLREQGILSKVQQQFLGRELMVTREEVKEFMRNPPKMGSDRSAQYHVVDILFTVPDNASKEQIKITTGVADKMAARLRKGASTDSVVEDSQQNLKGQEVRQEDLGWRKVDQLPDLFAKEVVKMKSGQVLGPIEAPNGLHLLKLIDINSPAGDVSKLTEEQVMEMLYYRNLPKKLSPWLKELRDKAYVKINK